MRRKLLASGLLLLFACKGDEGSGLPPDQPVEQLSPEEEVVLCDSVGDYTAARIPPEEWVGYMCTLDSFGDAEGADIPARIASCKQLREACIASGEEEPLTFRCDADQDWTTCDVTVGQIETCYHDAISLLDRLIDDFTCDILDPARAMALQEKYGSALDDPLPASCDVIQANCPGAFGEEDDVEAGGEDPPAESRGPRLPFARWR